MFDKLVNKFGLDKLTHFAVGAWIVSLLSPLGWYGVLVGFILTMVLGFAKEAFFDKKFCAKDILAGMFGGAVSVVLYLIIFLLM